MYLGSVEFLGFLGGALFVKYFTVSHFLSSEIKAVKKRKERAKELEGIDMSNIVSSSRRRSAFSYTPPPKPKIEAESDEDGEEDEDDDNEEDSDEGDNEDSSEGSDGGICLHAQRTYF